MYDDHKISLKHCKSGVNLFMNNMNILKEEFNKNSPDADLKKSKTSQESSRKDIRDSVVDNSRLSDLQMREDHKISNGRGPSAHSRVSTPRSTNSYCEVQNPENLIHQSSVISPENINIQFQERRKSGHSEEAKSPNRPRVNPQKKDGKDEIFTVEADFRGIELGEYLMQGNVFSLKNQNNKGEDIYLKVGQKNCTVSPNKAKDNIASNLLSCKIVPKSNDKNSSKDYILDQSSLFCAVPLDPHLKMEVDLVRSIEKYLRLYIESQSGQEDFYSEESEEESIHRSEDEIREESEDEFSQESEDEFSQELEEESKHKLEVEFKKEQEVKQKKKN